MQGEKLQQVLVNFEDLTRNCFIAVTVEKTLRLAEVACTDLHLHLHLNLQYFLCYVKPLTDQDPSNRQRSFCLKTLLGAKNGILIDFSRNEVYFSTRNLQFAQNEFTQCC